MMEVLKGGLVGQVGSHPSHRSHWRSAFPSPVGPSGRLVGWNAFFGGTSGDFGGASGAERTPQWDRWDASGAERTPRWDRWEAQRTPKSPTRNAFWLFGGLSGIGGVSVGETVFSVGQAWWDQWEKSGLLAAHHCGCALC